MLRLPVRILGIVQSMGRCLHSSVAKTPITLKHINQISIAPAIVQLPLYSPKQHVIYDKIRNEKIIECPKDSYLTEIREIIKDNNSLELPCLPNVAKIEAARLIVIRRRKMKKHKLKKLRKKMKFEWAKVRQRREMRKEKAFQAVLISQVKQAEQFSAENYVMSKIKEANEVPIPRFWKGKRLPQFIIKQKLGIS